MRELTKEQKKLLDKWYLENKEVVARTYCIVRQPEFNILDKLEELNFYETLVVDIERYLNDKQWSGR